MTDNSFVWTPELVNEYAEKYRFNSGRYTIEQFQQSKLAPPPVKEREDWEIIDCMGATGKLHKYEPKLCLGADKTVLPCTIHSVLRKSDNQVFTVGDEVIWDWERSMAEYFTITGFRIICDDSLRVYMTGTYQDFISLNKSNLRLYQLQPVTVQSSIKEETPTVKERIEPEDISNASKYWEQFRKLPIGNAEMIMHLATYAKQAALNEDTVVRPPLGVIPMWLHREQRLDDINAAIERYNKAFKEIPQEWINEKQTLQSWLQPEKTDTVVEDNDELVGLLRDCVSSTWGNPSLDKTQVLFDKFLHDRKLAKPTQQLLNSFITDAVNRNIYDKKYSQQEVDAIRSQAWATGKYCDYNTYTEYVEKTGIKPPVHAQPTAADTGKELPEFQVGDEVEFDMFQVNLEHPLAAHTPIRVKGKIKNCFYFKNTANVMFNRPSDFHIEYREFEFSKLTRINEKLPPKEQSKPVTDNSDVICLSLEDVLKLVRTVSDSTSGEDNKRYLNSRLRELVKEKLKQ